MYQGGINNSNLFSVDGECNCFYCSILRKLVNVLHNKENISAIANDIKIEDTSQKFYYHKDNHRQICIFCLEHIEKMYSLYNHNQISFFLACYQKLSFCFPLTFCRTCSSKFERFLKYSTNENLH